MPCPLHSGSGQDPPELLSLSQLSLVCQVQSIHPSHAHLVKGSPHIVENRDNTLSTIETDSSGSVGSIRSLSTSPTLLCLNHQRERESQEQAINSFRNLTHLDISGNSAEKLDLRSLQKLEWLCCSNNSLEVLILSGNSLTYLDCSNNNLQSVSVEPIPNNLSTLQISNNKLEELPAWTWMVPELLSLSASHNHLRQLDCKFQNCLANLPIRELHLHCNKIEFVSKDFIQRATRLKVLNLSQNKIEHMPNFGRRCPIQELYMSRNRLQDTDERDALDFLSEAAHLRRLYLAFNKIEHINERYLSVWKHLEELIVCGNRIAELPTKISTLTRLKVLRVHSNRLSSAPNLIKMPSLKVVDLSHNNLRKVNLDNLISGRNLTYLDISCNDRLTLDPEKLNYPKRPMNLVEVSTRKPTYALTMKKMNENSPPTFPSNPPWELGFSELPDMRFSNGLTTTQFRDVNLSDGKEALFGIFDGGEGNPAPKIISKSISRLFSDERKIEETNKFSLKYTLLNAMKGIREKGNGRSVKGILCLMSMEPVPHAQGRHTFTLNIAMIGGMRALLIETGKKVRRLTDLEEIPPKSDSSKDAPPNEADMSIPDPKILSIPLSTSAEYLLVANQAVWSHVSEEEILSEVDTHRHKKAVLIAKRITEMAQSHACRQSLSLILVRFKWSSGGGGGGNPKGGFRTLGSYEKTKMALLGDMGPLSYGYSGCSSSDYSDPTTGGSGGGGGGHGGSVGDSAIDVEDTDSGSDKRKVVPSVKKLIESHNLNIQNVQKSVPEKHKEKPKEYDNESLTNTSISHMSIEQFKCWEYMLEQNTKTLFKKELDSLSKGVFSRNQKNRKSVHFPHQDIGEKALEMNNGKGSLGKSAGKLSSVAPYNVNAEVKASNKQKSHQNQENAGFYTLSKAKSLSHLFAADAGNNGEGRISENYYSTVNPTGHTVKMNLPIFGTNSGAFRGHQQAAPPQHTCQDGGKVKNVKRGSILGGGPNSAYFGNPQRLLSPSLQQQQVLHHGEIQEVRNNYDSEHESRLKKYWSEANKITEL